MKEKVIRNDMFMADEQNSLFLFFCYVFCFFLFLAEEGREGTYRVFYRRVGGSSKGLAMEGAPQIWPYQIGNSIVDPRDDLSFSCLSLFDPPHK